MDPPWPIQMEPRKARYEEARRAAHATLAGLIEAEEDCRDACEINGHRVLKSAYSRRDISHLAKGKTPADDSVLVPPIPEDTVPVLTHLPPEVYHAAQLLVIVGANEQTAPREAARKFVLIPFTRWAWRTPHDHGSTRPTSHTTKSWNSAEPWRL